MNKKNPIFRDYDIRGLYPREINKRIAYRLGRALATLFKCKKAVLGRDTRTSGLKLFRSLSRGLTEQGVNVWDIGIASTDVLYFATSKYRADLGIEITASHKEAKFNGFKFLTKDLRPLGRGMGMEGLEKIFEENKFRKIKRQGKIVKKNIAEAFIKFSFDFTKKLVKEKRPLRKAIKPFKIVVDAADGAAGPIWQRAFRKLNVRFVPLNFETSGRFTHKEPNPFLPEVRENLSRKVIKDGADLGIGLDGDGDRIIFIDEKGEYVPGEIIVGLMAERLLKDCLKGLILHDVRAYKFIVERVKVAGGRLRKVLVGHSHFKKAMKEKKAIFGGESSGHLYFNFGALAAENGLVAFLVILKILSEKSESFSEMAKVKKLYPSSGELNFKVRDVEGVIKKIEGRYEEGDVSYFDTLSIEFPNWRFNLRPSANDPVIRLNVEADNWDLLREKIKEISENIKSFD